MSRPANYQGQRATIMGLGLFGGGVGAARYLAKQGARVTVTDLRSETELAAAIAQLEGLGIEFVLGEHRTRDFTSTDLLVVNPAVRPNNRYVQNAYRAGVRISSEIALFLDACPARVVAITGTNGKSSTSSQLAQLLEQAGERVHLGGNIGRSLLSDLPRMRADDLCVLELSSYQLESLPEQLRGSRRDSRIEAAAILTIGSDHLERHGTREEYARAKLRLLECMAPGATLVLPGDPLPVSFVLPEDLDVLTAGSSALRIDGLEFRLGSKCLGRLLDSPFKVPFQQNNLLVALGLAATLGVAPGKLAAGLSTLQGLPHRLDLVGQLEGKPLWDNGVSTTPDSTISALDALPRGLCVLMGGRAKALDLAPLIECLQRRETRVVLFGEAGEAWGEVLNEAQVEHQVAPGPNAALELARELPIEGILFSPACSSFDAFPNFKARAEGFLAHASSLGLVPTKRGR